MSTLIDLSQLPAPNIIEALDFEQINADIQADLIARMPELAEVLTLESEPVTRLIEVCAYRELLLRQRINDAASAVMMAFAAGTDLDQLAAFFDVSRLDGETDDAMRTRTQQSLYGLSVAGPKEAYARHARAAHDRIKDVEITSPSPGTVLVTILSLDADGAADDEQIAAVAAALSADTVRPLCDTVIVQSAIITQYSVIAAVETLSGPSNEAVRAAAQSAAEQYVDSAHKIDGAITRSGLYAALRQAGVTRVTLIAPAQPYSDTDILIQPDALGAAWCASVTVRLSEDNNA